MHYNHCMLQYNIQCSNSTTIGTEVLHVGVWYICICVSTWGKIDTVLLNRFGHHRHEHLSFLTCDTFVLEFYRFYLYSVIIICFIQLMWIYGSKRLVVWNVSCCDFLH